MTDIPERIREEAREHAHDIWLDLRNNGSASRAVGQISTALLAAEQRGREMEREAIAQWMIERSYATGHGDTTIDLLSELDWQITERIRSRSEQEKGE